MLKIAHIKSNEYFSNTLIPSILISIVIHCMLLTANAQGISRKVISSAGGTLTGGNYMLTYNIGETVISTLSTGNNIITQGFEQPGEELHTGNVTGPICIGNTVSVPYSAIDIGGGNTFTAQLSDAAGSFATPVNIGTQTGNGSGSMNVIIPLSVNPGTGYRVRVISSSPSVTGTDNGSSIVLNVCGSIVRLKLFLQGFYSGSSTMQATLYNLGISTIPTETDTIRVNLWSNGNLSNPEPNQTVLAVLNTDGTANMLFPASITGSSYYIAIKHRNHIETWSKNPKIFTGITEYDFSTALNQAYSDGILAPMQNVDESVYALYAGDINQDGAIDSQDMNIIDNEGGFFGYNVSDVNGDGATDAQDMNFIDNNSQLGLFFARPY